jgi:hypothetical protein
MTALYPEDLRLNPSSVLLMYPLPDRRMPVLEIETERRTALAFTRDQTLDFSVKAISDIWIRQSAEEQALEPY